MDLPLIKEIIILEPPTKWTLVYKKPKYDKKGNLIEKKDFYLTANLFYADRTSFHITSNIIQDCKLFLKQKIGVLPHLEKMQLELIYSKPTHIDLDNKSYFWRKIFLDILKTPTEKQLKNSYSRGKNIITTNTIVDDDTSVISKMSEEFVIGEHKLIFKIYGRVIDEQKEIIF